ncbi:MAG TPA: CARDB domain-containing protein, partial [Dokdonella sp.]
MSSMPGTSSLAEAIETYALAGRLPFSELSAMGMRGHVRQRQQVSGDWGGSVYLTATATLAHARDQRPNLAFEAAPSASPVPVHDGQRLTLRATVANTGNVPAAASVLRWYDGNPDESGAPIGGEVMVAELAAGSRATVSQEWDTTGQVGEHTLWAVVDAAAALEESSEQDNRASIATTVLAPSELADLELLQADVTAEPSSIAALPSDVRIHGLLRNPGSVEAVAVVIRMHEQDSPSVTLAETVVDVPARGTAALELGFSATAPRTLRLVVMADADDAIDEASEANNKALVVVPFGQSLDLEVQNDDLGLLTQPALVGRPVEFDIVIRNRGTVDSPVVTLRADIVRGTDTTSILDGALQVPAGQSVTRRATWLPGSPGLAQLRVSVDPSGQVAEADEGNNDAQLDFDVFALDQPDLTFVGESLVFTPTPGLEAQPLTAQLGVRNLSAVDAHDVLVGLYSGDPATSGVMIGSTTLASIPGSTDATATIGVPDLGLRGDQRMFIRIDADDRLDEVDESNNVMVKPLRVLSLADLAVSVADVELDPPMPVPGEAVQARITVRNVGAQDAGGFSVQLFEGDAQSGTRVGPDEVVGMLPAGASTVVTWHWTLGISPGSRSVTARVDPDDGVREGSDANNVASLPFDVQDENFFANERYISPNGDGVQDAVAVVFLVEGPGPATVEIANGAGRAVRHFVDVNLNEASRGQVIWDGRDDRGRVVTDGEYYVSVAGAPGSSAPGGLLLTVDNNRSSLLEAVDSPHAVISELRGSLRAFRIPPQESPYRDHLFAIWNPDGQGEGLFRSDAFFTGVAPVLSPGWIQRFRLEHADPSIR